MEYLDAALAGQGRRLEVVEGTEVSDDLVPDVVEVVTSFCATRGAESAVAAAARYASASVLYWVAQEWSAGAPWPTKDSSSPTVV